MAEKGLRLIAKKGFTLFILESSSLLSVSIELCLANKHKTGMINLN